MLCTPDTLIRRLEADVAGFYAGYALYPLLLFTLMDNSLSLFTLDDDLYG